MTWLDRLLGIPVPKTPEDEEAAADRDVVQAQSEEGERLRSAIDKVLIDWEKDFEHINAQVKVTKREKSYEDLWGKRP